MIEYEKEFSTHIRIFDKKESVTEDMKIWLMSLVIHMLFLKKYNI